MTSNINPNNIDGAYPVAGQDNNSQGFRDNFTNTKTNFAYASAEITDLQNKAVLKAALTGTTLNNDMGGSILNNAQLQGMSNTVVALGTVSGSVTINYSAGSYQTVTASAPISLDFTNFTAAGTQDYVVVQITITDISQTVTLPVAVGTGASATTAIGIAGLDTMTNVITYAASGTYVYSFSTADAGSTIYINDLTQGRTIFGGLTTVEDLQVDGQLFMNWVYGNGAPQPGAVMLPVTANIYDIGNASYRFRDAYFSGNVAVAGNISGNIVIDNIESIVGNVTAGNLLTGGQVSATANITGGNILTAGILSATGNVRGGNINTAGLASITGNVVSGNVLTGGLISATANITGGNILTAGIISSTGNAVHGNVSAVAHTGSYVSVSGNVTSGNVLTAGIMSSTGNATHGNISVSGSFTGNLNVQPPVRANITATNTYSLSTTNSINLLVANNTGYTATLNMPDTPVNGQVCNFAIHGNTVTLAVGTGTVSPTFAGSTTVGTGYRYVYYTTDNTWYRVG
jgi:hypothetical protein